MLSFGRLALDSVVRNRRRTLYAVIGVTLALSMISGSLIAVDSAAYGILRDRLEALPVDFYGQGYSGSSMEVDLDLYEEVVSRVLAVDGVEGATFAVSHYGWHFLNEEGDEYQSSPYDWSPSSSLVFIPSGQDILIERYRLSGDAPSPGTVAVPAAVATSLGISVGDEITCSYQSNIWDYENQTGTTSFANMTFEVSQVWTQEDVEEDYWQWWYPGDEVPGSVSLAGVTNPVVLLMEDAPAVIEAVEGVNVDGFSETYLVWIDRDEFVNTNNIALSIYELDALRTRLDRAGRQDSASFYTPLSSVLMSLSDDLAQKKAVFVGLSLPVVVMGLYLSAIGVDMGMTDRRRELGVLKSRGASNRQVFMSLLSESVFLGMLSGALGLVFGLLLSRFLVIAVSGAFDASGSEVSISSLSVSVWTVAAAMSSGVLLMFLSSYRPMKRISRMPVAESLHHYTQKTVKVQYKAKWDVAALSLVVLSVVSVLWLQDITDWWYRGSYVLFAALMVVVVVGWVIVPAVPFLLSVSVVRLVTRGSRGLYTRFTWLFRSWTKELHYIVEKNIARNPKRASNIGVIVSLAVAFGLFVSITMESEMAHAERIVVYDVGADIKYTGTPMYNGSGFAPVDYAVLEGVGSVEGVHASAMFTVQWGYWGWDYGSLASFHSEEVSEVVDIGSGWYAEGSRDITDLEENGTVFLSEEFAERTYTIVGNVVEFGFPTQAGDDPYETEVVYFDLRVIGILKQLPGLVQDMYVDSDTLSFIDETSYQAYTTVGFFVDVEDGEDDSEVADRVVGVCRLAGLEGYALVAEEQLDRMMTTPEFRTVRDFLYLEYALSMVVLTCGVGLVLFVTVWDRRVELACMMARGSSAEQMRRILMGESLSLMTLGVVVGVAAGLTSAFLYGVLVGETDSSYVPRELVFTWVSWAMVLAAVGSFLLASLLATRSAGRIRLAEVLRVRGG